MKFRAKVIFSVYGNSESWDDFKRMILDNAEMWTLGGSLEGYDYSTKPKIKRVMKKRNSL